MEFGRKTSFDEQSRKLTTMAPIDAERPREIARKGAKAQRNEVGLLRLTGIVCFAPLRLGVRIPLRLDGHP